MTKEPRDEQDIANLLAELGKETPDYPAELLNQRRAAYRESVVALGIGLAAGQALAGSVGVASGASAGAVSGEGAGAAGAGSAGAAGAGGAAAASAGVLGTGLAVETILKILIAALLLVEAVGGTVLYRRYVSQRNLLVSTATSSLTITASPGPSDTPTATSTPTGTPTGTPTVSPTFGATPGLTQNGKPGGNSGGNPTPTPQNPPPTPTPGDDNGNKYGHTPTPPGHRDGPQNTSTTAQH